ncbi:hypothetical protein JCM10212_004232 [Sporobolomyces blumeae]
MMPSTSIAAGAVNATAWVGSSFHSCNADRIAGEQPCWANITFSGSSIALFGDHNPNQRRYLCVLVGESEYRWFNGSELASGVSETTDSLNHTRCRVDGLDTSRPHTLAFGQLAQDVSRNGITLDYYVVDNTTSNATTPSWTSDFAAALPPTGFGWTTETIISEAPSSTSQAADASTSAAAAATSDPAFDGSSSRPGDGNAKALGIGLGVGLGAGLALVGLGAWFLWKRAKRRREPDENGSIKTEPMRDGRTVGPASVADDVRGDEHGSLPFHGHAASAYAPSQLVHAYGPPTSEFGAAPSMRSFSGMTVPEVQDVDPSTGSRNTGSGYGGVQSLDSPATFRERGR